MAAVLNTLRRISARARPAPGGRVESRRANRLGTGAVLRRRISFAFARRFASNRQHCAEVVMGDRRLSALLLQKAAVRSAALAE
jgi:hypothetical protein